MHRDKNTPSNSGSGQEGGVPSPDRKEEKSQCNVWLFIGLSVLCAVIAWFVMDRANERLDATHAKIIEHQQKSIQSIDSLLCIYKTLTTDTVKPIGGKEIAQLNSQLLKVAEASEEKFTGERICNLLESELSKIQNEYEVLNLWCALLTVVFLIFSFFSIFKANEMANQSEDALKRMRDIKREVEKKSESIESDIRLAKTKIGEVEQSISKLQTDHNNLDSQYKTLKETEIKSIQDQSEDLKEKIANLGGFVKVTKEELNSHFAGLKMQLDREFESKLNDLKSEIEDLAKSSVDKSNKDLVLRLDTVEKELERLQSDFTAITTGKEENDEVDGKEDEERDEDQENRDDSDDPDDDDDKDKPEK